MPIFALQTAAPVEAVADAAATMMLPLPRLPAAASPAPMLLLPLLLLPLVPPAAATALGVSVAHDTVFPPLVAQLMYRLFYYVSISQITLRLYRDVER